jgi:hypothetical protein
MRVSSPSLSVCLLCTTLTCGTVLAQGAGTILALQPDRLLPSNPVHSGVTDFGAAVDLDGTVLVVGSPSEDSSDDPNDFNSGAARVYERQGGMWVERQKLTAPTQIAGEQFGSAVGVALGDDGVDFMVVGAPGYQSGSGRAYVYRRTNGGPWVFETALSQADPSNADLFGTDVDIDYYDPPNSPFDGSIFVIVVGAPQNWGPLPGDSQNGSISIFQRAGGPPTWGRTHEFFGANSYFLGASVAIAGPDVVAGSEFSDNGGFNAGGGLAFRQENFAGTVFHFAPTWYLDPSDPQSGAAGMGLSAAADYTNLDFGTAVLGAPRHDQGAFNAGAVYIFDLTPGGAGTFRNEVAMLQPPGLATASLFGTSVALSGRVLAVGAPGVQPDGAVFLYDRGTTKSDWTLAGQLTPAADPPPTGCRGGQGVALDVLTAALGCPGTTLPADDGVYMFDAGWIFADGLESGDTAAWSSQSGSCAPCTEAIGCRVVGGKAIFAVPMAGGGSGASVCADHGYQCVGAPVLTPPENACLAFHPGAPVSSDGNGWKQAVWCDDDDGLACQGRTGCHHCPACDDTNLDCTTSGSSLLSELFVECVCVN